MACLLSPANVMKEGGTIDVGRYELVYKIAGENLKRGMPGLRPAVRYQRSIRFITAVLLYSIVRGKMELEVFQFLVSKYPTPHLRLRDYSANHSHLDKLIDVGTKVPHTCGGYKPAQ